MVGFNPFILFIGILQVGGCFYSLIKDKDTFTFTIYMCYAFANIFFALGPANCAKIFKIGGGA